MLNLRIIYILTFLISTSFIVDSALLKADTMTPHYVDAAHKSNYDYTDINRRYPELKTFNERNKGIRPYYYKDDAKHGGPEVDQAPKGIDASQRNYIESKATGAVVGGL